MYTLTKHKKRGADGFKDFVKNLELFPSRTVRDMIMITLLEDPVYLKWALQNRISFDYFLNLEIDEVLKTYEELTNPLMIFAFALKGTPEEKDFIESKLPTPLQRQYWEEAETRDVSFEQRDTARIRIMEVAFKLERLGELPKISWTIPPEGVLNGSSYTIDTDGNFIQLYDDGKTALKGMVEKKLRVGRWEHYYPNGELLAIGYYLSGEKVDEWTFYYPDGSLKSKGRYHLDKKHGIWEETDKAGNKYTLTFENGRIT